MNHPNLEAGLTPFDEPIDRRASDSLKWNRYPPDVLPMWIADMDFRAPEPIMASLERRVAHGVFGYSDRAAELGSAIAEHISGRWGWQVSPDAVVPLPGVISGFNVAARMVAAPWAGILLPTPVYPPMLRVHSNLGMRLDPCRLRREADGRYAMDVDLLRAASRDTTRLLLLCNPQNPTGRVFAQQELDSAAELCLRYDLLICSDEIHGDLVYPGSRHIPIASLAPEVARRTITLVAPSKAYNVPGLACAAAVICDPSLRRRFLAAAMDLVPDVNLLGLAAGAAAYRHGADWLAACLSYLERNRDILTAFVRAHLPGMSVYPAEGTYLAWLDCRSLNLAEGPYRFFLRYARVALGDGEAFGEDGAGFVRLNFACRRGLLVKALESIRAALVEYGAGTGVPGDSRQG
jgi:cystathionine beta-lyase